LKLPRRSQDVRDARARRYLLKKGMKKEWDQPTRNKFVVVKNDERSWRCEEHFDIRHEKSVWNLMRWFLGLF